MEASWPHFLFLKETGAVALVNWAWPWHQENHSTIKEKTQPWEKERGYKSKLPPAAQPLWAFSTLSRFYFMDLVFTTVSYPPSGIGLCFGFPKFMHWIWKLICLPANPDQTWGTLNYRNSQKVEFSSAKTKLVVLIGGKGRREAGSRKQTEAPISVWL